jgi:hypothetical protein
MDAPPFPFVIPSAAEESAAHLRALSSGKTGAPIRRRKEASVGDQLKAFEKGRFRPTYAEANVGHPSFQKIGFGMNEWKDFS